MNKQTIGHRVGIAALFLALAVVLTGCGPSSIFRTSYVGFPPGVATDNLEAPRAFVDEPILYLSLGGSSSCPPKPTTIQVLDGVMEIEVKVSGGEVCTADFVVTTFEINLGPVPDSMVLVFEDGDRQELSVEPLKKS